MKWTTLGRGGRSEKPGPLRTAAAGGHAHDFEDELRARSQRFAARKGSSFPVDSAVPPITSPLLPTFSVGGPSSDGSSRPSTRLSGHLQSPRDSSALNKMLKEALGDADGPAKKSRSKKGRSSAGSVRSVRSGASSRAGKSSALPGQRQRGDMEPQDDDGSVDSQESETSTVLSANFKKIRGYLPKASKSRRKSRQSSSAKEQDPLGPGAHRTSGKKKGPKYRSSKSAWHSDQREEFGASHRTASTCNSLSVSPNRGGPSPSGEKNRLRYSMVEINLNDMHTVEEEPSKIGAPGEILAPGGYSSKCKSVGDCPSVSNSVLKSSGFRKRSSYGNGPSSVYSSVCDSVQPQSVYSGSSLYSSVCNRIEAATKGITANLSADKRNGAATQAVDLPWMDSKSAGRLHGLYSGPAVILPHGEGTLVLDSVDGNGVLTFTGSWVDGELVTPLTKVDGKKGGAGSPEAGDGPSPAPKEYQTKHSSDGSARDPGPAKPKYSLGEVARSPSHMVIHRSNDEATSSASFLVKHERAFLKRSTGVWTCAYLADRSFQPTDAPSTRNHWHLENEIDPDSMALEESMLFVINEEGATKIIKRRHWGKFVRRIRAEGGKEKPAPEPEAAAAASCGDLSRCSF